MVQFVGAKYVDVRQRSPALGSKMGSRRSKGVAKLHVGTLNGADRVDHAHSTEEDPAEHGIGVQIGDDEPHMPADVPYEIGSSTEARAVRTTVIGLAQRT
jgi:hypothetical protein